MIPGIHLTKVERNKMTVIGKADLFFRFAVKVLKM